MQNLVMLVRSTSRSHSALLNSRVPANRDRRTSSRYAWPGERVLPYVAWGTFARPVGMTPK